MDLVTLLHENKSWKESCDVKWSVVLSKFKYETRPSLTNILLKYGILRRKKDLTFREAVANAYGSVAEGKFVKVFEAQQVKKAQNIVRAYGKARAAFKEESHSQ